jgi:predicted small secreted protein
VLAQLRSKTMSAKPTPAIKVLVQRSLTLVVSLAVAGACLALSACNTVKGVGRDVQGVGEAGERVIDDAGSGKSR